MGKNSGKSSGIDNLKPFKEGESGNPNGRPKGQRNYATIYREALQKIAESQDMTPEELETLMEQAGIKQALKGNFQFWKDIRDRIHGKAQENVKINVEHDDEKVRQKAKELIRGYIETHRDSS